MGNVTFAAPRIVAVGSGKGGVGKTWLSITLAHALARAGARVLLFDGDLGLANVDVQLGLMPVADLGAVAAGRVGLAEAILRHAGGFDILAGPSGSGALATLAPVALDAMLAALRAAACGYAVVILDLGAGIDHAVRRMASFADALLVVATEEPTSLTDAYALLKLHSADKAGAPEVQIAVNLASSEAAGRRTHAALATACARFLGHTPPLAGVIRRDDKVREAIRRQSLLLTRHPASTAAADVERLAGALLGGLALSASRRSEIPDCLPVR
jgi:flagellar biosynthesis protein FlhG